MVLLISQLRKFHAFATSSNYAQALHGCIETSNTAKLKTIHARIIKASKLPKPDALFIHNHLLNAYAKRGNIDDALNLFDEMRDRNVVSWTVLIGGLAQKGCPREAISFFSYMHSSGIMANEFTFVSVLQACSSSEISNLAFAFQVSALIIKLGFAGNVHLTNAFLTALIRHGKLHKATLVFEECDNRDIVSWNAIFDGYLKLKCESIPKLWHRMINCEGIKPDEFTFATVLSGLAELSNLELGLQIHSLAFKTGHSGERCIGNALVDMYMKNRRLNSGLKAFEEIPLKDVCSWTQMVSGCLSCGKPMEAIRAIREMRSNGVKPNKYTLATGFNACANLASFDEGLKLQSLTVKLGSDIDVCTYNALLDMYAKCGHMEGATKIFRSMNERSIVTWTTMIMGFAQNGQPHKALEVFEEMKAVQEPPKPNEVTFICLLYACSQGGYVDTGRKYFSSMSQEFGIVPTEDHYLCMVNLLGREGHIREAQQFIEEMPFEPSPLMWHTLLGACRLHGDVDAAKRAAESAIAADERNPSTYVLMSNLFADFGNWSSAETLRGWIENRDVLLRIPGSAWLEVKED